MDISGPLSKTEKESQFMFVVTGQYSQHTKTIPTLDMNVSLVARIFQKSWVVDYGDMCKVLT